MAELKAYGDQSQVDKVSSQRIQRPLVPVVSVKKVEVQGKVHGPGTVQSKVPVTVSAKITGIWLRAT